MTKKKKIILSIIAVVVIAAGYIGYSIYDFVMGSEALHGKLTNIPKPMAHPPAIAQGRADWPRWRGVNNDGKSRQKGIRTDWKGGLKKLWQINYLCQDNYTASWATPVVKGRYLVVPGRSKELDLVFCIDTLSGKLIWAGSYKAKAQSAHGPGARATPFIDGERVYTFGRSGTLVCWRLKDGKLLWRKDVSKTGGEEPQWGHSASPYVYKNKVFIQGGGSAMVRAHDKMNGKLIWKSQKGDAGYAALFVVSINKTERLIVFHGKGISALDIKTGKSLWTKKWETSYGVNATTPVLTDNILFFASGYDMGSMALSLTENNAEELWKNKEFTPDHTDPIEINGYLYGYSGKSSQNKGFFKCLELKSGRIKWSSGKAGWGTTVYADGHLINMDIKGNLFLIKPDPAGFKQISSMKNALGKVINPAWTIPVIANGRLYLRYMQRLICYDLVN
jgi:outer membrane protein assembly factor BamB